MIFCKRKGGQQYEFKLYGSNIEIVELYSYIRLTFTYNEKLTLAKKKLAEQAHKALYALYSKTRNFNIPIDRWTGTPCIERTCALYNNKSIGDELHYLYLCQNEQIQRLRVTCIPSYYFTNTCQNKLNGI
jgi:hypothetical protein